MSTDHSELLTDSQLARLLRVKVSWLKSEAKAGRIPCVEADGRFLFHRPTVERVLAVRASDGRAPDQVNIFQAAELLGIPIGFLERLCESRMIPHSRGPSPDAVDIRWVSFDLADILQLRRELDDREDA